MGLFELLSIAVGLSMDAFAVSVCIGLSLRDEKSNLKKACIAGLYFGIFQAVMPLIGYFAGSTFADKISGIDHWITFVILALIGGKMIKESLSGDDDKTDYSDLSAKKMLPFAIATSIDALAIGVTFSFHEINIFPTVGSIGAITFILSVVGVKIGGFFGSKSKNAAEIAGGVILILIGLKILLEHLEIIKF
jgi:putative Mn2+ efflux pump MntP